MRNHTKSFSVSLPQCNTNPVSDTLKTDSSLKYHKTTEMTEREVAWSILTWKITQAMETETHTFSGSTDGYKNNQIRLHSSVIISLEIETHTKTL